jgi:hypothetical protein
LQIIQLKNQLPSKSENSWCYLFPDDGNPENKELHQIARKIGLKNFQNHTFLPHYNLTLDQRELALKNRAIEKESTSTVCNLIFSKKMLSFQEAHPLWDTSLEKANDDLISLSTALKLSRQFFKRLTDITSLNLKNYNITKIEALKTLPNLQCLDLADNKITTIEWIADLTNLRSLHISGNPVININLIKNLVSLRELGVNNCQIEDLEFIRCFDKLETLYAKDNKISDIQPLLLLTELSWLDIRDNAIDDFNITLLHEKLRGCDIIYNNDLDTANK